MFFTVLEVGCAQIGSSCWGFCNPQWLGLKSFGSLYADLSGVWGFWDGIDVALKAPLCGFSNMEASGEPDFLYDVLGLQRHVPQDWGAGRRELCYLLFPNLRSHACTHYSHFLFKKRRFKCFLLTGKWSKNLWTC